MPIRLSGMTSGLDTDSIVQALISGYSVKKEKLVKSKTTMEWKKDAWKDLNSKIYKLYSTTLTSLKLSNAYTKKTTTCSDATKAKITASNSAINGSQSLQVEKLAKAGYLTGAKLTAAGGEKVTESTTLAELGYTGGNGTISLSVGGNTSDISVTANTKISDLLSELNNAGVKANFDQGNQRIFVSAKESGIENDFSLTGGDLGGIQALSSFGLFAASDANTEYYENLAAYEHTNISALLTTLKGLNDDNVALRGDNTRLSALKNSLTAYVEASQRAEDTLSRTGLSSADQAELRGYYSRDSSTLTAAEQVRVEALELQSVNNGSVTEDDLRSLKSDITSVVAYEESYTDEYGSTTDLAGYVQNVKDIISTLGGTGLPTGDQEKLKNYLR